MKIQIVPASVGTLEAFQNDPEEFSRLLGSPIPEGWPEFPEAIAFTLDFLAAASERDRAWSMHYFVDEASGELVGSGGYTAPPAERKVEIGYEIAPEYRGRGIGVASARALVDHALESGEVDRVVAHTLANENSSTGVLRSLGFELTGESEDPDEGTVWEWTL
ncbi:MAG: GNAT family N-acetyltransferase [Solirubrobacterales bacterium]